MYQGALCTDQFTFSTTTTWTNPRCLTIDCPCGVGNLTCKAFLGVGNFTFALVRSHESQAHITRVECNLLSDKRVSVMLQVIAERLYEK